MLVLTRREKSLLFSARIVRAGLWHYALMVIKLKLVLMRQRILPLIKKRY